MEKVIFELFVDDNASVGCKCGEFDLEKQHLEARWEPSQKTIDAIRKELLDQIELIKALLENKSEADKILDKQKEQTIEYHLRLLENPQLVWE